VPPLRPRPCNGLVPIVRKSSSSSSSSSSTAGRRRRRRTSDGLEVDDDAEGNFTFIDDPSMSSTGDDEVEDSTAIDDPYGSESGLIHLPFVISYNHMSLHCSSHLISIITLSR
jgi:hypothetical protein